MAGATGVKCVVAQLAHLQALVLSLSVHFFSSVGQDVKDANLVDFVVPIGIYDP